MKNRGCQRGNNQNNVGPKKSPMNNKYVKYVVSGVFITGIVLTSIGVIQYITTVQYNENIFSCTETHFKFKTTGQFKVYGEEIEIDAVLWEPKEEFDVYEKRPALVYLHGFGGEKMGFKNLAHELGKRGIVGLSITARGWGNSGGEVGIVNHNETLSAVKWLRDNADEYDIDVNRIGLVGISQGAFSVTLAAIFDNELGNDWINTTIVMDGPRVRVEGDPAEYDFVTIAITLGDWGYPTHDFDYEHEQELIYLRTSIPANNSSVPKNYLYLVAEHDILYPIEEAQEVLWYFGQEELYNTSDYHDIALDTQYGSFNNGTARKISYTLGQSHGGASATVPAREEMITWVETSFSLTGEINYPGALFVGTEMFKDDSQAGDLSLIGLIMIILPSCIFLGNYARNKRKTSDVARKIEGKILVKLFPLYGAAFVGTSALVIPVIKAFNLLNLIVVDFLLFNLLVLVLFVQALLLLPFIILFMFLEKKKYKEKSKDFGLDTDHQSYLKNVLFGGGIFLILYFVLAYLPIVPYFSLEIYPNRIWGFLEAFAILLIPCLVYTLFYCGMIQTKLSRYEKDKLLFIPIPGLREIIYTSVLTGIFSASAMSIVMQMFWLEVGVNYFPITWTTFFLFVGAFFALSLLLGWLYRRTRNILGLALFVALLIALIGATILPAI
ncbi:MAG: hypothetical protein ACFFCS_18205 [Candidatus Hodarchaeota archaeon]